MSKFDKIRSFLEELADPKTNEEINKSLYIIYRNAQEIIACYPDVATFLINLTNVVETFPMKRVLQAKAAIRKNNAAIFEDDSDFDSDDHSTSIKPVSWYHHNINSLLRFSLRDELKMSLGEIDEMMKKINSVQGKEFDSEEAERLLAGFSKTNRIVFKGVANDLGDTYYLIKSYFKYVVFIQGEDGAGILYEVKYK